MPTPQVILGDSAREQLREGIDLLARIVSLTLGPRAGVVACTNPTKSSGPEALTSSAVIARRIVEIPGRGANVGTMLLRHALWRMHEQCGDGGATMAALAHALLASGLRQVAAGANPMLLRRGMERGLSAAVAALRAQAQPLDEQRRLAGLAHTAAGDPELGAVLGEIFGRLGPEAAVMIEEYAATYVAIQLLEGVSWKGDLVSPLFLADEAAGHTRLAAPRILIADQTIEQPEQIIPLLEHFVRSGGGPLLILAHDVTGAARTLLLANRARGVLNVAAAKLDLVGDQRRQTLEDIAIATNAYRFAPDRSDRLETATLDELGGARVAQVEKGKLTIVGGTGRMPLIAARRAAVRSQLARTASEEARRQMIERLGKLAGGMAVLKIGAASNTERAVRKELAERVIRFMPVAVEEGVVAGGGAAFLACQVALDDLAGTTDEHSVGAGLVRDALAAPMTWIARNAGQHPPLVLAASRERGPAAGYDALAEQVVDMWEANILDATKVARVALETAVSVATMALTTDALVLKRRPVVATMP
jgi:chaperonin GroEL